MGASTRFLTLVVTLVTAGTTAWAQDDTGEKRPWDLRFDLSYAQTSGNSDTETFATTGEYKADYSPHRWQVKGGYLFTKSEGETTANRSGLAGRYDYLFTERMFGFAEFDVLSDEFAGYDFRGSIGPGLGYDFIKTDAHLLQGLASVLYTYADLTDDGTDSYMSGKAAGEYTWQINESTRFRQLLDYQVSFDDTEVYFVNSETALEHSLSTHIGAALRYLINYQNSPPGTAEHTDRVLLASLAITY